MSDNIYKANREAARKAGQTTYEGKTCRNGHTTRYVANGHCLECDSAYRQDHRDQVNAQVRVRYRAKHPEVMKVKYATKEDAKAARRAQSRQREAGYYAQQRRRDRLLKTYGLTQADFDALLLAQNGICPICERVLDLTAKGVVCVDHDHSSNVVRGLLHSKCNKALGLLSDDPGICMNAVMYLLNSSEVPECTA